MDYPIFITNAKTYPQITGDGIIALAMSHAKVTRDLGVTVGLAVSPFAIASVSSIVPEIITFAQHTDACEAGRNTGAQLPESAKWAGAEVTLINHSEHRVENVKAHIDRAKAAGLQVVVCAESPAEVEVFATYGPDAIAYEPADLIGGEGKSVSEAKPEIIAQSVEAASGVPLLVGAGIKTEADIKVALELGASGFLVASGVVKADDPEALLYELVGAIRQFAMQE